jgi:hypothetical protein
MACEGGSAAATHRAMRRVVRHVRRRRKRRRRRPVRRRWQRRRRRRRRQRGGVDGGGRGRGRGRGRGLGRGRRRSGSRGLAGEVSRGRRGRDRGSRGHAGARQRGLIAQTCAGSRVTKSRGWAKWNCGRSRRGRGGRSRLIRNDLGRSCGCTLAFPRGLVVHSRARPHVAKSRPRDVNRSHPWREWRREVGEGAQGGSAPQPRKVLVVFLEVQTVPEAITHDVKYYYA